MDTRKENVEASAHADDRSSGKEDRIRRLYVTTRRVAHAIINSDDRADLIQRVCDLLTESTEYNAAWIALWDDNQAFRQCAESGLETAFPKIAARMQKGIYPDCVALCLEHDGVMAIADVAKECPDCILRNPCNGRGALCVALRYKDRCYGILTASVSMSYSGDPDEHDLIREVASDIAHALHSMDVHDQLLEKTNRLAYHESAFGRLISAIEQSGETILITDAEGVIEYANPAFLQTSGYTWHEVLGSKPSLINSGEHDHAFFQTMWQQLASGKQWSGQLTNRRKNGELYVVESTISPVRNTAEQIIGFVSVQRDVTRKITEQNERILLEKKLSHAQKMEAVGHLAGGMAHDYNNALQVILGYAGFLHESMTPETAMYQDVEQIIKAAEHAADLTRQILGFARRQIMLPTTLNLAEQIRDMEKMLKSLLGDQIELIVTAESDDLFVYLDPSQFQQILMNLCTNSRDAISDSGTVTIHIDSTTLDAQACSSYPDARPGPYVRVTIQDTGCGIPAADMDRIFDPFFSTKPDMKGTGLGLSNVYGIVSQNRGVILLDSKVNQGTRIELHFPATAPESPAKTEKAAEKPPDGGTETILVVDDDRAIVSALKQHLRSQGYTVIGALDPEKAIQLSIERGHYIHLLITDCVMKGMNGVQLANQLCEMQPDLKCLFMSGYSRDYINLSGFHNGAPQFLPKPFSLQTVSKKVREVLNAPV